MPWQKLVKFKEPHGWWRADTLVPDGNNEVDVWNDTGSFCWVAPWGSTPLVYHESTINGRPSAVSDDWNAIDVANWDDGEGAGYIEEELVADEVTASVVISKDIGFARFSFYVSGSGFDPGFRLDVQNWSPGTYQIGVSGDEFNFSDEFDLGTDLPDVVAITVSVGVEGMKINFAGLDIATIPVSNTDVFPTGFHPLFPDGQPDPVTHQDRDVVWFFVENELVHLFEVMIFDEIEDPLLIWKYVDCWYNGNCATPSLRLAQRDDSNEFGSSRIERVQVSSAQKSGRIPGPNAYW